MSGNGAPRARIGALQLLLLVVVALGFIGMLLVSDELLEPVPTATSAHTSVPSSSRSSSVLVPTRKDHIPETVPAPFVLVSAQAQVTAATAFAANGRTARVVMNAPRGAMSLATKAKEKAYLTVASTTTKSTTAAWHNEQFIMRNGAFDPTTSRQKGIIIALHDAAFAMGLSLVKELRCLGNDELIQVYYCTDDDLSVSSRQILVRHDKHLETIDVCSDLLQSKKLTKGLIPKFKNWWIKPLALYHTNVEEPMLLDADDFFLQNPEIIRHSASYQRTGTLFFYDRVMKCGLYLNNHLRGLGKIQYLRYILHNFNYTAFNIQNATPSAHVLDSFIYEGKTCHEQDSSIVAVDKRKPGKAMDVLWWLITELRMRMEFSWGDKEAFWLAYELAQQPYAFSPWGVSVISSSTNKDLKNHPETLCGSIAQFVPMENDEQPAKLLYVNGKALLDPIAQGLANTNRNANILYNAHPTHCVPRMVRTPPNISSSSTVDVEKDTRGRIIIGSINTKKTSKGDKAKKYPSECLVGLGSTLLPAHFASHLYRRRLHYLDITSKVTIHLDEC